MKRLTSISFLALALSAGALAQPAILEDGVLTIDHGVILGEGGNLFYKNIHLQVEDANRFSVLAAEPRNLAGVEKLTVQIQESQPAQVTVLVDGYVSMSCLALEEPAQRRVDKVFEVFLAETPLPSGVACAQVIKPFQQSLALDTAGLPAGAYTVRVNGVEAGFTLP